jgi:uncharacterized protein YdaU (DUF1376 family)
MSDKLTSPCFPMYPSDFFGDPKVRLMDGYEQAFYAVLLMNMWEFREVINSPHLPNDDQKLAKLLKISVKDWLKVKKAIFDCLIVSDDKIESGRLLRENTKQDKYRKSQSEKGKRGGRPCKPDKSRGFHPAKPKKTQGIFSVKPPNPNPKPNNLISSSDIDSGLTAAFKNASLKTNEKENSLLLNLKEILEKTKQRYPNQFDQQAIVVFVHANIRNKNHDAILHCINSLISAPEKVKAIPQYLESALKIENGKHNAAESEKKCNEFKKGNPLSELINHIGKTMPAP